MPIVFILCGIVKLMSSFLSQKACLNVRRMSRGVNARRYLSKSFIYFLCDEAACLLEIYWTSTTLQTQRGGKRFKNFCFLSTALIRGEERRISSLSRLERNSIKQICFPSPRGESSRTRRRRRTKSNCTYGRERETFLVQRGRKERLGGAWQNLIKALRLARLRIIYWDILQSRARHIAKLLLHENSAVMVIGSDWATSKPHSWHKPFLRSA